MEMLNNWIKEKESDHTLDINDKMYKMAKAMDHPELYYGSRNGMIGFEENKSSLRLDTALAGFLYRSDVCVPNLENISYDEMETSQSISLIISGKPYLGYVTKEVLNIPGIGLEENLWIDFNNLVPVGEFEAII